jgi:uncharacterized membrane protein YgcG
MPRRRFFVLALGACLVVSFFPTRALAQRSWRLANFEAALEVQPDGSLTVTETLQPSFVGSYNGIFRTIPVDYRTPEGFNYKLFVDLLGVTDEAGKELRCETSRQGHYIKYKIWIPGASDTTKTVLLRYRVENAIRYFDEHDELYWNATGTEWPVPIDQASAVIKLPSAAAGPRLRATAYTGPYGSTASDADVEVSGSQVSIRARHGLKYREGLTVVAGWDKGVVTEPGAMTLTWRFLRANWMLALPLLVFVVMFWLWYKRGRDPRLSEPVMVLYEPPEKLTPGEVGTLVDNTPDMRDITATLVDLAVRGYIRIEEGEEEGLIRKTRDYTFRLLKPDSEWGDLKEHERNLLQGMFTRLGRPGTVVSLLGPARAVVSLSSLENEFYQNLPGIRESLFKQLIASRYYRRNPQKVRNHYVGLGVAVMAVAGIGLTLWADWTGISLLTAILSGISSGLVVIIFAFVMPARTILGTRVRNQILGFEEFMNRAEKDHVARLVNSPEMFDKYLPYAMALGVESKWARAFENIYKHPPEWYQGYYGGTFRPAFLVHNLSAMSARAGSTLTSKPRSEGSGFGSSGSSGFGGGGFSGGGFGGGGGGAF